jgi:hypothetical protein
MERWAQAAQAYEVAVEQNPSLLPAHRRLEHLYAHKLGRRSLADQHTSAIEAINTRMRAHKTRRMAEIGAVDGGAEVKPMALDDPSAAPASDPVLEQRPCDIIVVCGLPRSGTSMMMQMLEAGGVAPLTDGERAADGDNPRGYYELEAAKHLRSDRTWLPQADGKGVKIIAQLLPFLPPRPHNFRIIFMQRDLDEVCASQQAMLANLDKQGARLPQDKLKQTYSAQIEGLRRMLGEHRSITTLWLDHAEVLALLSAGSETFRGGGHRRRPAIPVQGDVLELRMGHLHPLAEALTLGVGRDLDGHRRAAQRDDVGVDAEHIPDMHRPNEAHPLHGHGHHPRAGVLAGTDGPGDIHLRHHPAAEDVPGRIGIRRHRQRADHQLAFGLVAHGIFPIGQ